MPLSSNGMEGDADQTYIWGTNLSGALRWPCLAVGMLRLPLLRRSTAQHGPHNRRHKHGTWVVPTPPLLGKQCRLQCRMVEPLPAVSRVQARFNAFIRTFKEHATDDGYKYMMLLEEVRQAGWPAQHSVSDAEREVLCTSSLGYTAGNKAGACMVEAAAGCQPQTLPNFRPSGKLAPVADTCTWRDELQH